MTQHQKGDMSANSQRMSDAPVYYALVQVRFTPIAAMSNYVAGIQDALRQQFPLFKVIHSTYLQFEVKNPSQPPEPSLESVENWLMTDADRRSGFVLGNDFITFHTTNYDHHESFISSLIFGLSQLLKVTKPSLISQIGIRYLDAIFPAKNETIEQYLVKELHGIDFGLTPIQSIQESVYQTSVAPLVSDGLMVLRIHKINGQLGFPPDINPNGLILLDKFSDTKPGMHAIIDTDHYVKGNISPDLPLIKEQIFSLHTKIKNTFNSIISGYAREKWH